MNTETIYRLLDVCNGWGILRPESLIEFGLPEAIANELTEVFESNLFDHKATIYVEEKRVNQLRGIYGLRLLEYIAKRINADCSGVIATGRGTQAEQLKEAIRERLEDTNA